MKDMYMVEALQSVGSCGWRLCSRFVADVYLLEAGSMMCQMPNLIIEHKQSKRQHCVGSVYQTEPISICTFRFQIGACR
jgi:hypothetical protein